MYKSIKAFKIEDLITSSEIYFENGKIIINIGTKTGKLIQYKF